jgi:hypothetical protein
MKRTLIILVGLAVLLAACGGQAAKPTPTTAPTASASNPPTAPAVSATTAAPTQPSQFKLDPATACQSFSSRPDPVPGIPPISAGDWITGSASATVVLMEYGDYQ